MLVIVYAVFLYDHRPLTERPLFCVCKFGSVLYTQRGGMGGGGEGGRGGEAQTCLHKLPPRDRKTVPHAAPTIAINGLNPGSSDLKSDALSTEQLYSTSPRTPPMCARPAVNRL